MAYNNDVITYSHAFDLKFKELHIIFRVGSKVHRYASLYVLNHGVVKHRSVRVHTITVIEH